MKKGIGYAVAMLFIATSLLGCDTAIASPTIMETPSPTSEVFGKPNVYFFVLDEYSSFDMLSKYYGYDNKVFSDFLNGKGFNISRESYSTDNETEHCFCDILNLNYISRNFSESQCYKSISKAKLFSIFSSMGYSQFQISTSSKPFGGIASVTSKAAQTPGKAYTIGKNVGNIVAQNTFYDPLSGVNTGSSVDTKALNQWGVYPSNYIRSTKTYKSSALRSYADSFLKVFDYFEDPSHYAYAKPRVTYCYMTATHVPFAFNEYGGIISSGQSRDWKNKSVYLNQYKFVTKHMMATISTIVANDPNSIIIVMSDHGIRYHADCDLKHTFYITDKDSCRIMNAVYIKGKQYDIAGLSGINTLRYIVSLFDGQNYPAIKDPIASASPDRLKGIIPKPR